MFVVPLGIPPLSKAPNSIEALAAMLGLNNFIVLFFVFMAMILDELATIELTKYYGGGKSDCTSRYFLF